MSKRDTSAGGRRRPSRSAGAEGGRGGVPAEVGSEAAATAPGAESVDQLSFESALEALEEVVDRLEEGDLELESALARFEQGVRLARRCAGQLESAERRIEILMSEGGEWMERPFEVRPDDEAEDDV